MHKYLKVATAVLIAVSGSHARAGGIPVIDVANLVQTVQQVVNDITQINHQVQQIRQLQTQIESINGIRNLGNVFNDPRLKNYVPVEAFKVYDKAAPSQRTVAVPTPERQRSRDRAMPAPAR